MKYIVKDHPGLVRDPESKAIVNENKEAFKNYMKEKHIRDRNIQLEKEINNMKSDINEIKTLLLEIIKKQA